MADVATVYLVDAMDPKIAFQHKGYIETHDERGVWICDRDDCRGKRVFYPIHRIIKIEYNTGW